ncbi:thiol reductant ABC exporter subunit CydC [Thermanaerothrix sp.]|jgi:ATP-binding cassette subfamily C protein CydC|uniref:thiol reductant ABC exporter subunit CydC n=1 Tax=Thermanaerothrix sp. TaxID=2972675 RepID=UPI002ADDE977|nr:thiol reductant ABC exporter subunit CydC [Thermanaerothrix sp.]
MIVGRLVRFLRPFAGQVVISIFLGIAAIATGLGLLGTAAYLIAQAALHPSIAELHIAIVGVRFFGLARSVIRYLERWVSHGVNLRLLGQLQRWLYRTLVPLLPARHALLPSGDVLQRAIADLENLENFYVRFISPLLVMMVTTVGVVWFSGLLSSAFWPWVAVGLVGAGGLTPLLVYTLQNKPTLRQVEMGAALNTRMVEFIQGMEDYLLYGQEEDILAQIERLESTYHHLQRRRAHYRGLGNGLSQVWIGMTVWLVLWLGIDPVARGQFSGVLLVVLVAVVLASGEAVSALLQGAQNLPLALHSARRLLELEGLMSQVAEGGEDKDNSITGAPDILVRDLSFRYAPDAPLVLDRINLSIPFGRHIGLLGPSGAGKSTLVQLLLRFWAVEQGEIYLGGVPLAAWDEDALHQMFMVLEQRPHIFSDTLHGNLSMVAPQADESRLWWALEQVELAEWARRLPERLNTWVGNLGLQLSGGERQRLALARVFLSEAPIIILDEPTVHLDWTQAIRISARLMAWAEKRTLIWITHLPYGLERLDEIVVLRQGQIVEQGTPQDLERSRGFYTRMLNLARCYADGLAA